MTNIVLPQLGDGISKAVVACWHVPQGGAVKQGDEIVEVVTDKASFCIEAPVNGILKLVSVPKGEEVAVGAILGTIE